MTRINQFAKEMGVSNHDVLEMLEKRLGIQGKSHSSNLSDDQVAMLRGAFRGGGAEAEKPEKPLGAHKPNAPVKVVKAPHEPRPAAAKPSAENTQKAEQPEGRVEAPRAEAPVEAAPAPSRPAPPAPVKARWTRNC